VDHGEVEGGIPSVLIVNSPPPIPCGEVAMLVVMINYIAALGKPRRAPAGVLSADAAALYGVMTELLRVYQFRDRDRVGYHGSPLPVLCPGILTGADHSRSTSWPTRCASTRARQPRGRWIGEEAGGEAKRRSRRWPFHLHPVTRWGVRRYERCGSRHRRGECPGYCQASRLQSGASSSHLIAPWHGRRVAADDSWH